MRWSRCSPRPPTGQRTMLSWWLARGLSGNRQRSRRAGVDEVERRAALHLNRRTGIVGEYEHRVLVGRIVAPPPLPVQILPRAALRPEHVAAHNVRPDIGHPPAREGASAGLAGRAGGVGAV